MRCLEEGELRAWLAGRPAPGQAARLAPALEAAAAGRSGKGVGSGSSGSGSASTRSPRPWTETLPQSANSPPVRAPSARQPRRTTSVRPGPRP